MYLNKAMVYGNLTRDPEMKALPSGTNVTEFAIATNRRYKDRDGNWQDAVDYHNVVVFGRQAETSAQYLHKGSSAFIEGRLQTRSWEKDGQKQYRTEIIADRVQFGPKGGSSASDTPANTTNTTASNSSQSSNEQPPAPEYPDEEINPEDIPF